MNIFYTKCSNLEKEKRRRLDFGQDKKYETEDVTKAGMTLSCRSFSTFNHTHFKSDFQDHISMIFMLLCRSTFFGLDCR